MAKKRTPPRKSAARPPAGRPQAVARTAAAPPQTDFDVVLGLIDAARARAVAAVNTELIDLYWSIGEHLSRRVAADGWGQGTIKALAEHIGKRRANARGFSAQNLWRMRQFFETYRDRPKLSALLRELSRTNNTRLPDKVLLQAKLHEFYELAQGQAAPTLEGRGATTRRRPKTGRRR